MDSFFLFVMIIVGVFYIILFFKVWGMTNDVRELKNFFLGENQPSEDEQSEPSELAPKQSFMPGQRVFVKSVKKEAVFVGSTNNGFFLVKFDDDSSLITDLGNLAKL